MSPLILWLCYQHDPEWRCPVRLLHSVLSTLSQTKKPQRKFVAHLLGLLLMLPGHATFRNMSRYSSYHEKTLSRWYEGPFDWVSFNKSAITAAVPPEHEQALAIDASFIPKSGKQTYGLVAFGTGAIAELKRDSNSRASPGLISRRTVPTASVSNRPHPARTTPIQMPPGLICIWINSLDSSRHMTSVLYVT